jgi:glyoxylase-like metal-dependent hydrolase (beta-lactamase superfamily II)
VKLSERVYLVGSGAFGFGLPDPYDCHVYLIDGGDELALIDAGFGPGTDQILDIVRAEGFDPKRITKIVATHYHADHVGGAAAMKRATGASLYAPAEAAPTIRVADADQIGLNWAKSFGFYPADYEWEPTDVEMELTDGATIRVGELELEAIATPGHCMGHYCIRLVGRDRTYMFTSDCVFWGGAIIMQNVPDSNLQQYAASCNRLADTEFDALLPGHHLISLRNGRRHAQTAADEFNRIGLPKDLLR